MAGEERLRELEDKYEGYTVYDNRGDKIGKVDDLFIDETDREEYIGVKMGFLRRKTTLIPMDIVRVNEADRALEVSESKDHVKNAPSFDDDEDITAEYEERIRSYFGLESQTSSGSRGSYAGYTGATGAERRESGEDRYYGEADRTEGESSGADTEYGERTGTSAGTSDTGHGERSSSGTTAGGTAGAASRFERGGATEGSTGEETTSGAPRTRQTEETQTFEEGGRTKVRRRIIREEIIEEDA